ncbi:hypothetical protein EDE15_2161 [Edaphobacter aggregans]|uniref:Uncharacterized protein n=2 Tax=Edaphobacter aggregans TaxID=570835 RepID=A0A3R9Q9P0_9BACT|nr:hypothetical protein EDE15_2161 [Edaphobacter aggregans]
MRMSCFLRPLLPAFVLFLAHPSLAFPLQMEGARLQVAAAVSPPTIAIPAGSKVAVALTRAVWAKTAKAGDPLYLQTIFPVTAADHVGIPAGTYVEGVIDSIVQPTRKTSRAEIGVHFTKIIFANGYTIVLSGPDAHSAGGTSGSATSEKAPSIGPDGAPDTGLETTLSLVTVQVSQNNDILLDNGSQIEMTLEAPLVLDASRVAQAIPLSQAPKPGQFKPATLCRPIAGDPGSPGTPDTVIPGTPGTPPTVISSGIEGVPDTVIPGTPGTPPTVIPGMPGTPSTPDTVCPAPPLVVSSTPETLTVKQNPSAPQAAKK